MFIQQIGVSGGGGTTGGGSTYGPPPTLPSLLSPTTSGNGAQGQPTGQPARSGSAQAGDAFRSYVPMAGYVASGATVYGHYSQFTTFLNRGSEVTRLNDLLNSTTAPTINGVPRAQIFAQRNLAYTAANSRTMWGYNYSQYNAQYGTAAANTTRVGGWFSFLGKALSFLGAFLAVREYSNDRTEAAAMTSHRADISSAIQAHLGGGTLPDGVATAIAAGDHNALRTALSNAGCDAESSRTFVEQLRVTESRRQAASHNSSCSGWGLLAGIVLGVALVALTGPVGIMAIGATFCSGVCLANMGSQAFRRSQEGNESFMDGLLGPGTPQVITAFRNRPETATATA